MNYPAPYQLCNTTITQLTNSYLTMKFQHLQSDEIAHQQLCISKQPNSLPALSFGTLSNLPHHATFSQYQNMLFTNIIPPDLHPDPVQLATSLATCHNSAPHPTLKQIHSNSQVGRLKYLYMHIQILCFKSLKTSRYLFCP